MAGGDRCRQRMPPLAAREKAIPTTLVPKARRSDLPRLKDWGGGLGAIRTARTFGWDPQVVVVVVAAAGVVVVVVAAVTVAVGGVGVAAIVGVVLLLLLLELGPLLCALRHGGEGFRFERGAARGGMGEVGRRPGVKRWEEQEG